MISRPGAVTCLLAEAPGVYTRESIKDYAVKAH